MLYYTINFVLFMFMLIFLPAVYTIIQSRPWNYKGGSGSVFYVSYIHSITMIVVPIERAGKDNSNHTKILKIAKNCLKEF